MQDNQEKQEQEQLNNINYIEEINKLKQNTVTKEDYNKLVEENKKLLDSIINGTPSDEENDDDEYKLESSDTYRKMLSNDMTNLDYITTALNLREAVMAEGGEDPFVLTDTEGNVSDEQRASVEKVAEGLKYMVAEADGDPKYFNLLYDKMVVDPAGIALRSKATNSKKKK